MSQVPHASLGSGQCRHVVMSVHQMARHRIIHDALPCGEARRWCPPPTSHGAPACNYSLLSASDDGTSGQGYQWTPPLPSISTATMQGYAPTSSNRAVRPGSSKNRVARRIMYRREVIGISSPGNLRTCLWKLSMAAVPGTGMPSRSYLSAPSGLESPAGVPLTCQMLESDCRLGQRMSPRRTETRGGSRPQMCHGRPPRACQGAFCLFPTARSPSPSDRYLATLGHSPPPNREV